MFGVSLVYILIINYFFDFVNPFFNFSFNFFKKIVDFPDKIVYIVLQEVERMTAKKIITIGIAYAGITAAELAARLGWSPQLLNKRMNTGKFTVEEWQKIAAALGADFLIGFKFPDGKSVTL